MSTAPVYLSCIVNDGKLAIAEALIQGKKITPHSYTIGDTYGFTPTDDGTVVTGNVVYIGTKSLIKGSILSKDQFRFNLTVPESAGPFTVGNIMFYVQSDDGTVFPFIWVALKIPYPKSAQQPGSIGNRFVFELFEKLINVADILNIQITPSEYFSLAGYVNENELPPPSQALFQQFVVHEPVYSPVPFLGMRRSSDNSYWGMPLSFRIGDPFFGILDGGRAGEPKGPSQDRFFWGGTLSMEASDLPRTYGGTPLSQTPSYSIGGDPLPPNPGYPSYP